MFMLPRVVYSGEYSVIYNFTYDTCYSVYTYKRGVAIVDRSYFISTIEELLELLKTIDPINAELIVSRERIVRKMNG